MWCFETKDSPRRENEKRTWVWSEKTRRTAKYIATSSLPSFLKTTYTLCPRTGAKFTYGRRFDFPVVVNQSENNASSCFALPYKKFAFAFIPPTRLDSPPRSRTWLRRGFFGITVCLQSRRTARNRRITLEKRLRS